MYTQHFQLSELPFSIAPNPRYLFLSPQHREALAHLLYGIGVGGGFVVLTGEVGMGKTTLCRALIDQLPEDVDIALVFNPRLNSRELLASICDELSIPYSGPRASLKSLIDALNRHLLDAHAKGRRVLVLIDEAQNLRFDVLEQVRLLTNLETNQHKLLQIILVGQPELNEILDRPNLRQLAQRITARYHLEPLNLAATREYIRHRLKVADARNEIFSATGMREVFKRSGGIPRLVNLIGDRALLGAYTLGKKEVDRKIVRRAAVELKGSGVGAKTSLNLKSIGIGGLLIVLLGGGAWHLLRQGAPKIDVRSGFSLLGASKSSDTPSIATESSGSFEQSGAPEPLPFQFTEGKDEALKHLFGLWGIANPEGMKCGKAGRGDLRCQNFRGTWDALLKLNMSAVLELEGTEDAERFICVERVMGDQVVIRTASGSLPQSQERVKALWTGIAILAYRPLATDKRALRPGISDPVIREIRQELGLKSTTSEPSRFDENLRGQIQAFQRKIGLRPDGLIGTLTLIGIEGHGARPDVPRLLSTPLSEGLDVHHP
jgi:general secretion pathway protein A